VSAIRPDTKSLWILVIVVNIVNIIYYRASSDRVVCAVVPCLSICPSVTSRYCIKTAELRITQTIHTISQGLSLSGAKDYVEIRKESPPTRSPNAGGVGQNPRLSTNNWLCLENGT